MEYQANITDAAAAAGAAAADAAAAVVAAAAATGDAMHIYLLIRLK